MTNTTSVIKLIVDKNAAAEAQRVIERMKALLGETAKQELTVAGAAAKVNRELAEMARERGVQRIAADFVKATEEGRDLAAALETVSTQLAAIGASDAEIRGVVRQLERMKQVSKESGGKPGVNVSQTAGDASTGLSSLAGAVGSLGGGGQVFQAAGDILGAVEHLKLLGGSVATLAPAALIAAPAIIAVTVALAKYNQELEAARRLLTSALKAQDAYYQALQNATSEDAKRQIDELSNRKQFLQQQIEETQRGLDVVWQNAVANFGDAGARALEAAGQLPNTQLKEQLALLKDEMQNNVQTTTRLTQGLEQGAFAANDLAAAEAELTRQRLTDIERRVRDEIEANRLLRTGTSEQVRERLAANADELAAIQTIIGELTALSTTSDEAAALLAHYTDRQKELLNTNDILINQVSAGVAAREQEAAAIQATIGLIRGGVGEVVSVGKALFEGASAYVDMANDIREASKKLTADIGKLAAARDKAIATANQRLADGLKDLEADLREQQKKNHSQALKDLRKFNAEERQRVREHQQTLKDIRNRAALDIENAAANLDAAGVFRAQQQRDQALDSERSRFELENEQRRAALAELKASIAEQEQETVASYQRRHEQLIAANQREVQAARDHFIEEGNQRRQAYLQQAGELQAALNQELQLKARANQTFVNNALAALRQVQSAASQAQSLASSIGKSFGSIVSSIPKFAQGGDAPNTFIAGEQGAELIRLKAGGGAHVTNARDTKKLLGGMTVNQYFSGISDPERAADIAVQKIQRIIFNA